MGEGGCRRTGVEGEESWVHQSKKGRPVSQSRRAWGGMIDCEIVDGEGGKVGRDLAKGGEVGGVELSGAEFDCGREEEGSDPRRGFGGFCDLLGGW